MLLSDQASSGSIHSASFVLGQRALAVPLSGQCAGQRALRRHIAPVELLGPACLPLGRGRLAALDQHPGQIHPGPYVGGIDQRRFHQVRLGQIEIAALPRRQPQHVVPPGIGGPALRVAHEQVDRLAKSAIEEGGAGIAVVTLDVAAGGTATPVVHGRVPGRRRQGNRPRRREPRRQRHHHLNPLRRAPRRVRAAPRRARFTTTRRRQHQHGEPQPRRHPPQRRLRAVPFDSRDLHRGLPAVCPCRPTGPSRTGPQGRLMVGCEARQARGQSGGRTRRATLTRCREWNYPLLNGDRAARDRIALVSSGTRPTTSVRATDPQAVHDLDQAGVIGEAQRAGGATDNPSRWPRGLPARSRAPRRASDRGSCGAGRRRDPWPRAAAAGARGQARTRAQARIRAQVRSAELRCHHAPDRGEGARRRARDRRTR